MDNVLIKVTAIGYHSNVSTTYLESPKTTFVNSLKIWTIMPGNKGTEIRDESGRNVLIVKESLEELEELLNK